MTTTAIRKETVDLGGLELRLAPESYDPETREFEVIMSTGAAVRRYSWMTGAYDEILSIDPDHIRLDFFNSGRAPLCEEHRHYELDKVVGSIVAGSCRVENGQLIGRVRMHETERATEMAGRVQRGEVPNVSLGYRTYEQDVTEREDGPDTRTAVDWEPKELSLTPMPADDGAHTRSSTGGVECVVRFQHETMGTKTDTDPKDGAAGADPKKREGQKPEGGQPETEKRSADTGGAPAPEPEPDSPAPEQRSAPDSELETRALEQGARLERERSAAIRDLCKRQKADDDTAEDMIKRGISVREAKEELFEAFFERHTGPDVRHQTSVGLDERSKGAAAVERALLQRFDPVTYAFEERDDARQFGGDSLMELGMRRLSMLGSDTAALGGKNERVSAIFGVRAGYHTTSDFPGILENVARKILLDAYMAYQRDFLSLVRERAVPDFKEISVHRFGGASELKPVGEGSEYSYGTVGEEREKYKVAKYGRILALTREALINDDLDAFARLAQELGNKAALLEMKLFWSILADNPDMADGNPLFSVAHGNMVDGDISVGGLTEAYTAMRLQKDIDGEGRLMIMPRTIAVPTELRTKAMQELVLQTVPNTSDETSPFRSNMEVIETPFLSDSSALEWFLIADRRSVESFQLAYLQGSREPFIERREGFEVDGTEIKIRHEIGMKAIDWRGVVKSTGTVAK